MPANHQDPHPDTNEPCRGKCTGYGSQCCCPPLIVLAMHAQPLPVGGCFASFVPMPAERGRISHDR